MKNILAGTFALMAVIASISLAVAGDKQIPKQDQPVIATKATVVAVTSTPNDPTTPIVLSKPESAIDQAINTPLKYKEQDRSAPAVEAADNQLKVEEPKKGYRVKKYNSGPKKQPKKHLHHQAKRNSGAKTTPDTVPSQNNL